jgi:hypothetical protein
MPTTKSKPRKKKLKLSDRKLDAVRDTLDFRDLMYIPTLIEVPTKIPLTRFTKAGVPILDQGEEGACTGFGLATVIHYLLRKRAVVPDRGEVSPHMLYDMAKRYDEWPGVKYDGSSNRGAMKGWQKHGVCSLKFYDPEVRRMTDEAAREALRRPLGAYFRVNHKDIIAMHSAIAEVGALYASAVVHDGWDDVGTDGVITHVPGGDAAHAFAIVAYDEVGFWIQNSWGPDWGKRGFARIGYADWLENGMDVWVARLGAPILLGEHDATAIAMRPSSKGSRSYAFCDLRPHIISTGNEGLLRTSGTYGTDKDDVQDIMSRFAADSAQWPVQRLLLYAHGGLVGEDTALQRVAEYVGPATKAQIYPVAFIWRTDFWSTLTNILKDSLKQRRPEGILDAAKDFMLDRLDDTLETIARVAGGKAQRSEMKENALLATSAEEGGARIAANALDAIIPSLKKFQLHLVAHSAGSIYFARLVEYLTKQLGITIDTVTLWAPAITTALFKETYLPALQTGSIRRMTLFTLTDDAEQDDHCAHIYNKSLLYLVANAFEDRMRSPLSKKLGAQILGLERSAREDREISRAIKEGRIEWILSPHAAARPLSQATAHGGFDDDVATVKSTLSRILGGANTDKLEFKHNSSASSQRDRRQNLDILT